MTNFFTKTWAFISNVPKKFIYGTLLGITILLILLKFLGKATAVKAQEMNLGALIKSAVTDFKVKTNNDKIKELEKQVKTETDPDKVTEFYKNRK